MDITQTFFNRQETPSSREKNCEQFFQPAPFVREQRFVIAKSLA